MLSRICSGAALGLTLLIPAMSQAQGPVADEVSFQGYLTDDLGDPINDASTSITFKIYRDGVDI